MKDIQTHGIRFWAWYYWFCFCGHIPKSNLHNNRGITPKRVTSGGAHLRCLAPGQHSSEEISKRWRAVGDTVPIGPAREIEPKTSRTDGVRSTTELTGRCSHVPPGEKELNCFTRKASKGRFLLLIAAYRLTFYLQLACGSQGLCKTE